MVERRRGTLSEQIVENAHAEPEPVESMVGPDPKTITKDRLIPSGVTLLNCACSDNPDGAFAMGSINTIPGKSASGKTELMYTMLATCSVLERFNTYRLIMDDAEHASHFDLEYLFPPLVGRLEAPKYDGDEPVYSETIEDFEGSILTLCKKSKEPFIYILDSLDSLTSIPELEREWKNALKSAKSDEAVKKLSQSYGTEKARIIGQVLRMINKQIKVSDSALFIVQQTRQNMNRQNKWDRDWQTSGGEAPYFYSFHQIFLEQGATIKVESHNLKHQIGGVTRGEVVKNKLNGKKRSSGLEFAIYEDLGIDDIASCVDFLKKTGHWKSDSGGMEAPEFDIKLPRMDLIRHIENENPDLLRQIVGQVWNQAEDDIRLKDRKRRF